MSASSTDAQVKQTYSNIGDYYIDRQNWTGALEYYTMSNNTEGLKKCYMALEDNESLAKLFTGTPKPTKDGSVKQSILDEISDTSSQTPSVQGISQLRESGRMLQAAAMAFQLANIEASKKSSPLRIKKLYILAGHLYTQNSVDGAKSREAVRSYRLGAALHWLCAASVRARASPPRPDAALRAAARLRGALSDLPAPLHLQAWCTIAAIAIQARAFDLCSKAFIKLEALDADRFEALAIECFTRYKPKDVKSNKIDCPNCHMGMPEWMEACPGCASLFPGCAVSGRALITPHTVGICATCGARAQQHEMVLRHSCPMCHVQLD